MIYSRFPCMADPGVDRQAKRCAKKHQAYEVEDNPGAWQCLVCNKVYLTSDWKPAETS